MRTQSREHHIKKPTAGVARTPAHPYGKVQRHHVIVDKDTVMTRMVDVGLTGLKPGPEVRANTTAGAGGKPTAHCRHHAGHQTEPVPATLQTCRR